MRAEIVATLETTNPHTETMRDRSQRSGPRRQWEDCPPQLAIMLVGSSSKRSVGFVKLALGSYVVVLSTIL